MNECLLPVESHARWRNPRGGIALFTIIAVLAVMMMLVGSMLGRMVGEHRQSRLRHEERQCRRLAAAALDRAMLLRERDQNYTGETWTIAAADLGRARGAAVVIRLDGDEVTATASYPAGGTPRVRHTEARRIE